MPGCAAVGCNNRSEKGYIMKCFPRDPKLRKIWQERVARADWEPSNNSFLCHVHFEPQEWSITQSGRIRLKKNAVPSIFTITSTRKSPKKRTKLNNIKKEDTSPNEYAIEYLEIDTEQSSVSHLEEKDSDFQDIDDFSVRSLEEKTLKYFSKAVDFKDNAHTVLRGGNIILISENNFANVTNFIKQDNFEMETNADKDVTTTLINKKTGGSQMSNIFIKEEVKLEVMDHNAFDSYDEIEEKLKQICDGASTEDENKRKEGKQSPNKCQQDGKEKSDVTCDFDNAEHKNALPVNENNRSSTKNEIGHILADKQENVEIIFGTESGDDKTSVYQSMSYNKHPVTKVNKVDNILEYTEIIHIKDEKKVFNEDIEENFTKDEVHVIPNIRAAMKRKRRTREEIMKSIKKSIKNVSDQDVNSSSNSEMFESIVQEIETRNECLICPKDSRVAKDNDTPTETAKFIIKVTGDPEDVTEIIEELSSNTMGADVSQKFSTPYKNHESDTFVTSVITVVSPKNLKGTNDSDLNDLVTKDDEYRTSNKKVVDTPCEERELVNLHMLHSPIQCQPSSFRHSAPWSDEEDRNRVTTTNLSIQNCTHSTDVTLGNNSVCYIPCDYEELLERVKIQEDVIAKLTDQLIMYKELEHNFRNKTIAYEVQTKEAETVTHRVNTRSSNMNSSVVNKKNLESKQRLITDLSNRVNYFEETNKKLMKTVTLESQQKRKLEGQIKQKDNRIKELNWKLEKASKYLERAEKNTNTYRRKMLNMQTIMRRRKLLDEKMSKFNEMLLDSSKQEYSEKALVMAMEIRKTCGRNGYDKLLSYGFPLPPLPALRKGYFNDDYTDHNESDVDKLWNTRSNMKAEKLQGLKNDIKTEEKNSDHVSVNKAELDGAETVTGTVQDIFDENNDGDDFSTNELREHFILQLNAVM